MADSSLIAQAETLARDLTSLLKGSLPDAPPAIAQISGGRVVIRPERDVPLFVGDQPLASLSVHLRCRLDSRGTWLAIENSSYGLTALVDRSPVLRFDYVRKAHSAPSAHVQLHAHRGALTHLLSQAGHVRPHHMSALHIPVGGARFRPCLEDVVQFLVEECGFEHLNSWRVAVEGGRARWRGTQVRAVVRDFHQEPAETLRNLGYTVRPPEQPLPDPSLKALHAW